MNEIIKVTAVEPLDGHWVRLTFTDGAVKDVDLGAIFERGTVFAVIRENRALFEQVRVNAETGTIQWPGDVDHDAAVLYGRFEPASGVTVPRRAVRSPPPAHA